MSTCMYIAHLGKEQSLSLHLYLPLSCEEWREVHVGVGLYIIVNRAADLGKLFQEGPIGIKDCWEIK